MRNLKRALSLALAAIMLLGMMVVGASAVSLDEFSDVEDIVNKDAVSLLTILGIINGKEDGSFFDPTGDVTRAEMAKMISVILNKGADNNDLYVGATSSLTDVKGHWAEGHINYCSSLGIIAGRGNGTFDPAANVTASEAAKMLLVAVGYDPAIEGFVGGDWAVNVNAKASALGIFNNFSKNVTAPLNRDDAALLIYNFLDVERIEQYNGTYALVYNDRRTVLGEMYGVYKVKGVVTGNEWARLEETEYDERLSDGRTSMDHLQFYASNTQGTNTGNSTGSNNNNTGISLGNLGLIKQETPEEYLGQSVNMYVRKTTVLNDYEVLGVYLRENDNQVIKTAEVIDVDPDDNNFKTLLKGTGLAVGSDTEYYVNYGFTGKGSEGRTAAGEVLKLEANATATADRKVEAGTNLLDNQYGVELTIIDNNNDGIVDYVFWMQEDLTRITDLDDVKKTVNFQATNYYPDKELTSYNNSRPIDQDDVVFVDDADEGDIVLVRTYGGRWYVSQPEVVTGKMESYSADKTKEQYIVVDGETYHASFIKCSVDGEVEDLYAFDVAKCARRNDERAVQWDLTYDFYMDSNGHISAFKPSERVVPNYALILESGYDPGVYATDASGKITVVLSDGTTDTFALNFSASAKNLADQIEAYNDEHVGHEIGGNMTYTATQRVTELKGFLGTDYTDTSTSKPWNGTAPETDYVFARKDLVGNDNTVNTEDYKHSRAAGYVITYTLDEDNKLTIQSVVGSAVASDGSDQDFDMTNKDNFKPGYNLGAYHVDTVDTTKSYDKGDAQLNHSTANPNNANTTKTYMAIDLNTIAFYFWVDEDGENCGSVVTGYKNMVDIDAGDETLNFLATASGSRYNDGAYVSSRTNLAEMVVFNHKGPAASKNFVYILGRNNHYDSGKYVDLFGVDKDGKALTLKVKRSDWETDFDGKDNAYKKVWQYSTNADGVTSLTAIQENTISGHQVILGSVLRLTSGTVAFTAEDTYTVNRVPQYYNIDTYLSKTVYDKSFALETETGHVWNVRNLETGADASQGSISTNSPKHAIIILNEKDGTKIETAYVWDYTADEKTAPSGVVISANPDVSEIEKDGSVVLTASAAPGTSFTNAHYQWKVDGTNVGTDSATFTMNGADFDAGSHTVTVEVTDRYNTTPLTKNVTITVKAPGAVKGVTLTGVELYDTNGEELGENTSFGNTVTVIPGSGSIVVKKTTGGAFAADAYYKYNNKYYKTSSAGLLTIPVADLAENVSNIANTDFTEYVKYILDTGVTLAAGTAANYDATTGYALKTEQMTITVANTAGTGVVLSADGTLTHAAVGTAIGKAIATTGTFTPDAADHGDIYMKAAAKLIVTTPADVPTIVDNGDADGTSNVISNNDYVVVGTKVKLTSKTTGGTNGDNIQVSVDGGAAADVGGEGAVEYATGTPNDTPASAVYTMTIKDATFTLG
ncbi:MAG: S-layer homology domain-containing protein [Flavonifractor sp.]|nr:S-layer homology domain-containing protein [Flavonifractor sp.]